MSNPREILPTNLSVETVLEAMVSNQRPSMLIRRPGIVDKIDRVLRANGAAGEVDVVVAWLERARWIRRAFASTFVRASLPFLPVLCLAAPNIQAEAQKTLPQDQARADSAD